MLHSITWAAFLKAVLFLAFLYYGVIATLLFRKDLFRFLRRRGRGMTLLLPALVLAQLSAQAQTADATNGINQANTMVRGYYDVAVQLMYAIGGIFALIGALKVYDQWNSQDRHDVLKTAAGWFGGCIFLIVVATVIKSFFGL